MVAGELTPISVRIRIKYIRGIMAVGLEKHSYCNLGTKADTFLSAAK